MLFGMVSVTGIVGARAEDTTVTFDFPEMGYANAATVTDVTSNGVVLTFAQGGNSNNPPKYYNTGTAVRMYPQNTLTIEAEQNIKKIEFTFSSNSNTGPLGADVGTYSGKTWTGEGTKVVFTNNGGSGHARIQKIVVTLGEGSVEPPATATPFVPPTTPEEIVEAAYKLDEGDELAEGPYTLTGVVTGIVAVYTSGNGYVTLNIVVGDMTDKPIQCYKLINGTAIASGEGIEVVKENDTVTVNGELSNYQGTVQFNENCKLTELVPGAELPTYETAQEIWEATKARANNVILPGGPYTLTGTVTEIVSEYSTQYKNIELDIEVDGYTFRCFRLKNGSAIETGKGVEIVAVGDTVTVSGQIKHFIKNADDLVEFDSGCTLDNLVQVPPLPQASVTAVAEENLPTAAPLYDETHQPTGETTAVDAAYTFAAVEPTAEQVAYYGGWYCDYRVSFDATLAAKSFGLYGNYGEYGDIAFLYPVEANSTPVYLLASLGLDSHLTYNEILSLVNPFTCGVFNKSAANAGKTMTVDLVIWAPGTDPTDATVVATTSYTFPVPPMPQATVTEVAEENLPTAAPLYDETLQPIGETTAVDAAFIFTAVEPTDLQVAYYGGWYCDYRVSFDATLAAKSFGLYGNYGEYGDIAFLYPTEANSTPVYLLSSLGLDTRLTYNEVLSLVNPFTCGVFNKSADNAGKTMTVDLVIWAPGTDPTDATVVATTSYTFPVPPMPQATVTEVAEENLPTAAPLYDETLQPTGETTAVDAAYIFTAVTPTDEQVAYYGTWCCDYRVSFDDTLAANSFGLYGNYGTYGDIAFLYPVEGNTTPVFLLQLLGLDEHLTYNEILSVVNPFTCGVFNKSTANAGKTMKVELVIWERGTDPAEATVLATTSYTFPAYVPPMPEANVTEVTENLPTAAPLYDIETQQPTGETTAVDAAYIFTAVEPTAEQVAYYGTWCCDYRVSFDATLAAESFGLFGNYGDYGDIAFLYPVEGNSTPVYLLAAFGLDEHLTYNEVLSLVNPFTCGVFNKSADNAGKTMKVELVMWERGTDPADATVVATTTYTFPAYVPPMPEATVTEVTETLPTAATLYNVETLQPTGETTAVDAAYKFTAVEPTAEQVAYYGTWCCDYRVSFDDTLAANSFGLYGNYGTYGDIAFLYPVEGNTTPVFLLQLLGLDEHLTYNEILSVVNPFTCGVFNKSTANAGKTMKVELVIWERGTDPAEATVLATTSYTFPQNYTVTLTSQDTDGNTGIATVTGGGEFIPGAEVTVAAPELEGFTFIGWFEGEYAGDPVSTEATYTFVIAGNRNLIAVYESSGMIGDLHIIGSKYTVDGGIEQQSNADFDKEIGKTVELKYTGEDFLYWVNISGNIISTSETYTFTFVGETTIRLITTRNLETQASVYVVFLNAYSQVLNEGRAIDEEGVEDIFPKTNPSKMGETFVKWVFEGTEVEATAEAIFDKASDSENVIVKVVPLYEKTGDTYTLTVKVINGGAAQEVEGYAGLEIPAGQAKTLTVAEIAELMDIDAETFSFWSYDGETPVSVNDFCTVVGLKDQEVTVYLVFGVSVESLQPTIVITQMSAEPSGQKYKLMTTERWFAPEGYTVQEVGFVYGTNAAFANDPDALVIGGTGVVKHISYQTSATGIYTLNITASDASKTLYIKGFLTYTDGDGNVITVYTAMRQGSYNSLAGN